MDKVDKQIMVLIDILKTNGTIRFNTDFCGEIGLTKQHFQHIKNGTNHFTPEHINNIIKSYNVNANWIFSQSDKIFINHPFNPNLVTKEDKALKEH
jgi:hypothetical protein